MKNGRRTVKFLVLALILFTVFTSLFLIAHEADHNCIGDGCPVCLAIATCLKVFKALGKAVYAVAFILSLTAAVSLSRSDKKCAPVRTPISLKVKLTD